MKKHYALLILCAALSHSSSSLAMQKLSDDKLHLLTRTITEQKRRIAMEQRILDDKIAQLNAHQKYMQHQERQHLSQKELRAVRLKELEAKANSMKENLTQSDKRIAFISNAYAELCAELEKARERYKEEETDTEA